MTYEELENKVEYYFTKTDYCCAEVMLKSLLEYNNVAHDENDISLASAFGGGIGGCGCVCGAITGAVLAFAFIFRNEKAPYTKEEIEKSEASGKKLAPQKNVSAVLAKKLYAYFESKYNKTCCKILTEEYKKDRKAKKAYCIILNKEINIFAAKLVEEYKANN